MNMYFDDSWRSSYSSIHLGPSKSAAVASESLQELSSVFQRCKVDQYDQITKNGAIESHNMGQMKQFAFILLFALDEIDRMGTRQKRLNCSLHF